MKTLTGLVLDAIFCIVTTFVQPGVERLYDRGHIDPLIDAIGVVVNTNIVLPVSKFILPKQQADEPKE